MIGDEASAIPPEVFVRLLLKLVCLVTYFSKIISLPGNQSSLVYLS